MKTFATALALTLMTSCSYPKSVPEFREKARDSGWVNKIEFDLTGVTQAQIKARMEKYSDKCFRGMQVSSTSTSYTQMGTMRMPVTSTSTAQYDPYIEVEPGRISLAIKRNGSGYDVYILLADLDKKSNPTTWHGTIYYPIHLPGDVYGNIGQNTADWLTDAKKLCPEVK